MTTQTSPPFGCRQCGFCNEAFRVDGGSTGIESARHGAWFATGACLQLANLFASEPGEINESARDALIKTYNNCYTKVGKDGERIHIPKINAEKVDREVREGKIFIVKGVYDKTTDENHFGKYD